jgi:hypothetical protein
VSSPFTFPSAPHSPLVGLQPQFGTVFGWQSIFDVPHPRTVLQALQLVLGRGGGLGFLAAACRRPAMRGFVMLTRPSRSTLMS